METKAIYFVHIIFSSVLLSTCSDVKQGISPLAVKQDSLAALRVEEQQSALNTIDTLISIFTDGEVTESGESSFSAGYLDSASNNLFAMRDAYEHDNPYGFEKDQLVTYPDSVYRQRFAELTTEIPLVYNRQVENFIDLYAVRKKALTERMFGKSMLYFPYIERVLMEQGLPHELKYLTMVESALHADARSSMAAVGLWQIRYRTGKWLGLEINDYFDERKDPYASTQAAVNYLERLHNTYGSWPMALAAYNSGPGNVNKAIMRAGGSRDFWRIRRYLPTETRSYVPAFMAIVYLSEYYQEHNIRPVTPDLPFQAVDSVRVYDELYFSELSESLAMQEQDLLFLNPAFIKGIIPASKEGNVLVLPLDKIARFEEKKAEALKNKRVAQVEKTAQVLTKKVDVVPDNDDLKLIEHRVRRGQTIGGISDRYGVDIEDIREWNGMRSNIIRVGQDLKIYVPASRVGR
jgi:membrane-bound lytic murein transglycosylase D